MEQKVIDSVIEKLEYNGRKSYKDVASDASIKLGKKISIADVNDVIEHLFQTKQIFGFSTVIDPRAFDLYQVIIWVKGEEDYNIIRHELMERAPKWGNIADVRSLFGEYDFWIRMHAKTIAEANLDINNIITSVKYFSPITTIQTELYRKYGFDIKKPINPSFKYEPDAVDHKIIRLLQQNCRQTDEDIALSLSMDSVEVSKRIKKMEDDSIILGYNLLINQIERNTPGAIVDIHLGNIREYKHVAKKLMNYSKENVRGIYSALGGGGHITIECFHNSIKELSNLIDNINNMDEIRRTKSHIIAEFVYKDLAIPIE